MYIHVYLHDDWTSPVLKCRQNSHKALTIEGKYLDNFLHKLPKAPSEKLLGLSFLLLAKSALLNYAIMSCVCYVNYISTFSKNGLSQMIPQRSFHKIL